MSEVVTQGLRQYVQYARHGDSADGQGTGGSPARRRGAGRSAAAQSAAAQSAAGRSAAGRSAAARSAADRSAADRYGQEAPGQAPVAGSPVLPERIAAGLRELRSSGRSELLSATLAALSEAGWPLRPLAEALGVSRQAVQARVRRRVPAELRNHVTNCEPPPPFPHRREADVNGHRPHLTIRIDQTLRTAAHRTAAHEGRSLSQVVEAILDRYLRHGITNADQPSRRVRRPGPRSV